MTKEKEEKIEIVRGNGNVYADIGHSDADARQMKAFLAAEIIAVLNRRRLTVRAAAELTGVTPSDISNIRNAHLGKFTIDRLVRLLNRLDRKVTVVVKKAGHGTVAA
jgi:predicted XRE-type DNA-binding protein